MSLTPGLSSRLDKLTARHNELSAQLADPGLSGGDIAKLSKEYSDLTPMVESIAALREAEQERAELQGLLGGEDAEMRDLAQGEIAALDKKIPELESAIKVMLLPKDEADARNAILELRAGTGGDEAALFAGELFRMYQRYAALKGWTFEIMELSETGIGGFKEAIASITGRNVFERLKFESGVHRVQRVPETENSGRVHTSAATVAVLP
ncbi:MAG: PCRF domain-containing protein, partial [Stellaceae bacterium]